MLTGKCALITGSARGVGAAIARRMADHGATVVISDVLETEGRGVAESIGDNAYFVSLDVTDEAAWQRAVDHVLQTTGHIDVLVNNAAVLHLGSIQNTDADAFRRVLDVNATGPFLGIRAVVDPMTQSGGGSIINISSVDGLVPLNGMSAYVTSKWGLRGLTKTAALELGRAGITVNCICPTGGNSQLTEPWWEKLARFQDELDGYGRSRGIPRTSRLEEIADAAVFLASDMARFITGIDLPVDGGHTAGNHLEAFAHVDDRV